MKSDRLLEQTMEKIQGRKVHVHYSLGADWNDVVGTIVGFDNFAILLEADVSGKSMLIMKDKISVIEWE